ncbi:MAG: hypothetical protein J0L84_13065 [Verrucomicrobia bacterium]|nr:hypothetical protein [Verrucomicrobiota bacterium]
MVRCHRTSPPLSATSARRALERVVRRLPGYSGSHHGRGIVICAGGPTYFTNAWVCLNMLRHLGCILPVQLWHLGPDEMDDWMREQVAPLGATCVDAQQVRQRHPCRILNGWELKAYALLHSPFQEVLLLDADNVPVADPSRLFETPEFRDTGALFWPDIPTSRMDGRAWALCGLPEMDVPPFETGQVALDKRRCWKALQLTLWLNEHSDFWYRHTLGDKETFHLAWRKLGAPFAMPRRWPRLLAATMCQHDFRDRVVFQHRNTAKWDLYRHNPRIAGFRFERECLRYLATLRRRRIRHRRNAGLAPERQANPSPQGMAGT